MLSQSSKKAVSTLRRSYARLLPAGARQYMQRVSRSKLLEQRGGFPSTSRPQVLRLNDQPLRWMSAEPQSEEGKEKPEEVKEEASKTPEAAPINIKGKEEIVGEEKSYGFQAETRQLLDIVTHSLYADREVFVRELVSNASDALEKARHVLLTSQGGADTEKLSISISVDAAEKMFVIVDNGLGMTKEEMMENLGTIARSGSKAFLNQLANQAGQGNDLKNSIIGKFGVGFYSAFMVSEKVQVFSRKRGEDAGHCWTSQGDGSYTIAPASGVEEGTKIVLYLRTDALDFAKEETVKTIVNKYSSFVAYPILCNGKRVNEVDALWLKPADSITTEEHTNLYRHLAKAYDAPTYTLVFRVLTKRVIRWLIDEAKKSEKDYEEFYKNFGLMLKEGVAMDQKNAPQLAKLLRYPSSAIENDEVTSLDAYVSRMREGQDTIYYLVANSYNVAVSSPYFEAFKKAGIEVLFCYNDHDEIVLANLARFGDKQLKSIEVVEPPKELIEKMEEKKEGEEKDKEEASTPSMSEDESKELTSWMKESLGKRVSDVQATERLVDSPAIISDHDNAVTRKLMRMSEFKSMGVTQPAGYKLLVNLKHPILVSLSKAKGENPELAKLVAEQLLDNAILSAGILDEAREMLPRLNEILKSVLK
ncbi:hypothetical protein GUITHDRAFT_166939 [Guillardia theta CCMP2712]|uniref:Histidine kinase/HSP90-like ATPase domain-containing protein n=1 Tax=Guillardia theta (strain CCMP2712) TaxID=905079 RepID=L1I5N1_GUITC|nr:hypothetical protein GUITHDRAFT_166939 [Guillardia theta CCMP2712]EKX31165.1 hypothetical protein GUITHDRAFT_166939 [Guillardia theta CCMP2712]|eukprot:XP_005818145.1 hypothetical protein GUITHDRAFT_166939 [Guillardia theta CCMP2712]